MRIATPHTLQGAFALVTLLLAGTVLGQIAGLRFGEALYLTVLLLTLIGWLGNHLRLTTRDEGR
ncbi:MAG: hypothetical protein K8I60_00465 [Anaerolineae bacterium]|nr:hypothetical protein [Anaerolineae bacterium]